METLQFERKTKMNRIELNTFPNRANNDNKGGTLNSGTSNLRIHLFTVGKNDPKLYIHNILVLFPSYTRGF